MAPKKKGQKMDLSDFLADSTIGGSWADEMEELPSGPSGDPALSSGGPGLGGSHLSQNQRYGDRPGRPGDRFDDRPPRVEVPIPTEPPYTAFVGNLSWEVRELDLEDFFAPSKVNSVRLVTGHDGKLKGFGYVEFETVDDLKAALDKSGTDFGGRVVRISVAEPQQSRAGRADDGDWVRSGPLAPLPGRSGDRGGFRSPSGASTFGPGEDRDAPLRGGKFVPSAPTERRGFGGGFGGAREGGRDFSGSSQPEVERDAPIRGGKFIPSPEPVSSGRPGFGDRKVSEGSSRADEGPWVRGGPLPPRQPSGGFGSRGGFERSTPPTEAPVRQRLQLAPRSTSATSSPSADSSAAAPSSKASPFGAAKPIDSSEREKAIEEKLAKEREATQAKLAATAAAEKEKKSAAKDDVEDKIAAARKATSPDGGNKAAVPPASLRKEGFSYSAMAGTQQKPEDEAAAKDSA